MPKLPKLSYEHQPTIAEAVATGICTRLKCTAYDPTDPWDSNGYCHATTRMALYYGKCSKREARIVPVKGKHLGYTPPTPRDPNAGYSPDDWDSGPVPVPDKKVYLDKMDDPVPF
jgi:hypothetical protein